MNKNNAEKPANGTVFTVMIFLKINCKTSAKIIERIKNTIKFGSTNKGVMAI
jgi:hypothetical protein